ncbi:hypothetical protein LCM10_14175 [Rossellomorea aquimaris]|uniref:hypothetical protein n=1 Tax=Rossellomorea aquimaris TaxID=189382 RepID=UPI001CD481D1|nr:hypothetical protein [Rossellomorea aquimaris]MCA1056143.1 hypothetical protein [Rossellomorea aquimaris]
MIGLMLLMVSIAVLIVLYRKSDKEEPYLVLKLVGYTVLGAAMLTVNGIQIPIGFVVFLLFFRTIGVNAWSKKRAAYAGFAVFLLSVILSFAVREWDEWPRKVTLEHTNFYEGSLLEEWEKIKKELDVENEYGIKLTDFRMVISKEGEYERLDLSLVDESYPEVVHYTIRLSADGESLKVRRRKTDAEQWGQNSYTEAAFALTQFDLINKSMLDDGSMNYYELNSDGQRMGYDVRDQKNFRIDTAGKKELKNSELPVNAITLDVCGTEGTIDEHGTIFECGPFEHFLFDVMERKLELHSGTALEIARKSSPEIDQWLTEHLGDRISREADGEYFLLVDGKEKPVSQQEYMKALKETPMVGVNEMGEEKWKVTVENPYGDAPHTMTFEIDGSGEDPVVTELDFR